MRGARATQARPKGATVGVVGIALGLVLAGCSTAASTVTPPAQAPGKPYTYVAIGGSESVGNDANDPVRQAFTVLLEHELPPQTVFYDLGATGATATDVLTHQVGAARSLHPNLVTVWVGLRDLEEGASTELFGSQLRQIIAPLRKERATVLVANLEPITLAPAYQPCLGHPPPSPDSRSFHCFVDHFFPQNSIPPVAVTTAAVAAYNVEVAEVARSTGAVLVDVNHAMTRPVSGDAGSLFSNDDFDLSTSGHALAAALFIAAWRSNGGSATRSSR